MPLVRNLIGSCWTGSRKTSGEGLRVNKSSRSKCIVKKIRLSSQQRNWRWGSTRLVEGSAGGSVSDHQGDQGMEVLNIGLINPFHIRSLLLYHRCLLLLNVRTE